jgi:hypothetical protein
VGAPDPTEEGQGDPRNARNIVEIPYDKVLQRGLTSSAVRLIRHVAKFSFRDRAKMRATATATVAQTQMEMLTRAKRWMETVAMVSRTSVDLGYEKYDLAWGFTEGEEDDKEDEDDGVEEEDEDDEEDAEGSGSGTGQNHDRLDKDSGADDDEDDDDDNGSGDDADDAAGDDAAAYSEHKDEAEEDDDDESMEHERPARVPHFKPPKPPRTPVSLRNTKLQVNTT